MRPTATTRRDARLSFQYAWVIGWNDTFGSEEIWRLVVGASDDRGLHDSM